MSQFGEYLNTPISCACGRTHYAAIKTVEISGGALGKVTGLLKRDGYKKPFVVADQNTLAVAGEKLLKAFDGEEIPYSTLIFNQSILSPNEEALGTLLMNFDPSCDIIVAVGSGTINDLSRFFSYQLGLPYYIVATAPSMDGYASTVAPLIKNDLKTTFECHVAEAIIGDLDILAKAPKEMIAAGFGDVVGKYTCLADWKLSAIINNEYYCERVVELTKQSIERTVHAQEGLSRGDKEAVKELMEALVLSGIAMTYVGNSRPASGSEHHIAHFWEMRFLWEGRKPLLHGTKVGISAVLVLKIMEKLLAEDLKAEDLKDISAPDMSLWEDAVQDIFSKGAPEILALEAIAKKNDPDLRKERLERIISHWDDIVEVLRSVPKPELAADLLANLGAPVEPGEAAIEPQLVYDAILLAKEIRARYTVLQLLWDLDLLAAFANEMVPGLPW